MIFNKKKKITACEMLRIKTGVYWLGIKSDAEKRLKPYESIINNYLIVINIYSIVL